MNENEEQGNEGDETETETRMQEEKKKTNLRREQHTLKKPVSDISNNFTLIYFKI